MKNLHEQLIFRNNKTSYFFIHILCISKYFRQALETIY